ncbi:hypothetical protein HOY82DRAFT_617822 [Tuber indicum]|nr:hypothetical protein HOY82DRAFT_617822 [Tuber indicum]
MTTQTVSGITFGDATDSIAYNTPDGRVEVIGTRKQVRLLQMLMGCEADGRHYGGRAPRFWYFRRSPRCFSAMIVYLRGFLGKEYSEINPTNCHRFDRPMDTDGVPSFNLVQADDKTVSTVTVGMIVAPTDYSDTSKEAPIAVAKALRIEILEIIHKPAQPHLLANLAGTWCDAAVVMYYISKDFMEKHKRTLLSVTLSIQSIPDVPDFHFTTTRVQYELSPNVFNQIGRSWRILRRKWSWTLWTLIIISGRTSHTPKSSLALLHTSQIQGQ